MSKEIDKKGDEIPTEVPLYGLYFDGSPESWESVWVLESYGVHFALLKPTDDIKAPRLVTPVGPYFGLEGVKNFAPMDKAVREYIASREDHTTEGKLKHSSKKKEFRAD